VGIVLPVAVVVVVGVVVVAAVGYWIDAHADPASR
jgi:hypothetical protein